MSRARSVGPGLCLALMAGAVSCGFDVPPTEPPPPPTLDAQLRQSLSVFGVVPIAPLPQQDPALIALGRALFFDRELSGNRDIACATCHSPATHATDGRSLAVGTGATGTGDSRVPGPGRRYHARSAPTLLNIGIGLYNVFWDGRVFGFGSGPFEVPPPVQFPPALPNILAAQAMLPVLDRQEMRGDSGDLDVRGDPNELALIANDRPQEIWQALMRRLLAIPGYATMFAAAYPVVSPASLGFQHATGAIAAFEVQALGRTSSPFDRYLRRDDAALTPDEKRGALLFFGRARCSTCHNGPFLGGQDFANVGAPQLGPGTGPRAPLDLGRGNLVDGQFYEFAFRVAPLRNVELTAPYFHSGAYATLENVVRHYNNVPVALRGFDVSQLAPALRDTYHGEQATVDEILSRLDFRLRPPLGLTESEIQVVVAFLKSLTDPAARDLGALVPASVPSGLPVRD